MPTVLPRWRVAKSLNVLLDQINSVAPKRSKLSDGSIGDAAHASRSSDHNPWVKDDGIGVVTARDFTHDPAGGFNAHTFAEVLKANADVRIKYVISNGRIWTPAVSNAWRVYTGVNSHAKHTHVSVREQKQHYDNPAPWMLYSVQKSEPPPGRAPYAMTVFQKLGWKDYQAAALTAQGMWESGGHSRNDIITFARGDAGTAHGGWQWRLDRYVGPRGLLWYAKSNGHSSADLELQINFVNWELSNSERRAGDLLRAAETLEQACEAGIAYCRPAGFTWENPRGGHGWDKRLEIAKRLLNGTPST
jgi:hypothetical protein